MASPSSELQKFILDILRADDAVGDLVGDRIYDGPPEGAQFPYLNFETGDFLNADADCIRAFEETLQIDAWARSNSRTHVVKDIVWAVVDALHEQSGSMGDYALVEMTAAGRWMRDPDGITTHGIITVSALIDKEYA